MSDKKKLNLIELTNESLVKDLTTALGVDADILVRLAAKVNTRDGFLLKDSDAVEVVRIWEESGLSKEKLNDALGVLRFFYKTSIEEDVPVDTVLDEIKALCDEKQISGFESRTEALRELLTPRPLFFERKQFMPVARGIERNLESISGVVEMRGVFNDQESEEVVGYVPVAMIRLTCGFDMDEKEQSVRFAFQVTEEGLAKLIRSLETYRKQLSAVKKTVPEDLMCFEDIEDTEDAGE